MDEAPEKWNMGLWPPRPRKCKLLKEMHRISNRFVKGTRIVEYGLVAAAAPRLLPKGAQEEGDSCK